MSYINTLVDSMPRRLEAVRAAQEGRLSTGYCLLGS